MIWFCYITIGNHLYISSRANINNSICEFDLKTLEAFSNKWLRSNYNYRNSFASLKSDYFLCKSDTISAVSVIFEYLESNTHDCAAVSKLSALTLMKGIEIERTKGFLLKCHNVQPNSYELNFLLAELYLVQDSLQNSIRYLNNNIELENRKRFKKLNRKISRKNIN